MSEPVWIELDVVRRAHAEHLAEHGGPAGIRDVGMLESAVNRPRNLFAYAETPPSMFALAASYAFGLAKNHPFVDGNKRTAAVVCLGFLRVNGIAVRADQVEVYKMFYGLAASDVSEDELAAWLEAHQV